MDHDDTDRTVRAAIFWLGLTIVTVPVGLAVIQLAAIIRTGSPADLDTDNAFTFGLGAANALSGIIGYLFGRRAD